VVLYSKSIEIVFSFEFAYIHFRLICRYKIDEDLTSLNISVFNQDLPGEKEISGASATMTIKEISNHILLDISIHTNMKVDF